MLVVVKVDAWAWREKRRLMQSRAGAENQFVLSVLNQWGIGSLQIASRMGRLGKGKHLINWHLQ